MIAWVPCAAKRTSRRCTKQAWRISAASGSVATFPADVAMIRWSGTAQGLPPCCRVGKVNKRITALTKFREVASRYAGRSGTQVIKRTRIVKTFLQMRRLRQDLLRVADDAASHQWGIGVEPHLLQRIALTIDCKSLFVWHHCVSKSIRNLSPAEG